MRDFRVTDTYLLRGWVTPNAWRNLDSVEPVPDRIVPFLKVSYRAGPHSKLAEIMKALPGNTIRMYLKVNGRDAGELISVPYNSSTGRYEIELWGDHGADLRAAFSASDSKRGLECLERGELLTRPDLILGEKGEFDREGKDGVDVRSVSAACTMHPLNPLRVEVAWADKSATYWDSNGGGNYHYEFNMMVRGSELIS